MRDLVEQGFEALKPYGGHEPYLFLGGRRIDTGEELEVAMADREPMRCTVIGTHQRLGYVNVKLTVMRSDGPFEVRFVLSEGTLVRRPRGEP